MSTNVCVGISPETTTRPVLTSVSQATRPAGSSRMTASRTPSEIWSATLSGWPSVTDSDVNRYSLSLSWLIGSRGSLRVVACLRAYECLARSLRAESLAAFLCSPVTALHEIDDHG